MRKLFILGFICLILPGLSCKKNGTRLAYRAKVISMYCSTAVIDVEGNNGIGTTYSDGAVTYNNAVVVTDYCYLADKNVQKGNTIAFNITPDQTAVGSNCAITLCIARVGPNKYIHINDVEIVTP